MFWGGGTASVKALDIMRDAYKNSGALSVHESGEKCLEEIMAKGQMRTSKEKRKPKKNADEKKKK